LLERFPYLKIGEVLADAALGYEACLDPIWEVGALRMVDIRAAQGDEDHQVQLNHGYKNEEGQPLCPHGEPMRSNGHDYDRHRTKWCCEKGCLKIQGEGAGPGPPSTAPDCPYQAAEYQHGYVVNVGRILPVGVCAWP